jgi:hypothetical protein
MPSPDGLRFAMSHTSHWRELVGLRHPLIHHGAATAADQIPKPVAQESVLFEGDDGLAVLPAQAQIVAPAVLAPPDRGLIGRHGSSLLISNTQYHRNRK